MLPDLREVWDQEDILPKCPSVTPSVSARIAQEIDEKDASGKVPGEADSTARLLALQHELSEFRAEQSSRTLITLSVLALLTVLVVIQDQQIREWKALVLHAR